MYHIDIQNVQDLFVDFFEVYGPKFFIDVLRLYFSYLLMARDFLQKKLNRGGIKCPPQFLVEWFNKLVILVASRGSIFEFPSTTHSLKPTAKASKSFSSCQKSLFPFEVERVYFQGLTFGWFHRESHVSSTIQFNLVHSSPSIFLHLAT